jgi:hypothetical protein
MVTALNDQGGAPVPSGNFAQGKARQCSQLPISCGRLQRRWPQSHDERLLSGAGLMLPRCRRRADIVGRMPPSGFRRGRLPWRCRIGRCGLVLRKAVTAALTQLRIGDWSAFPAHSCLTEAPVGFQQPIVTLALNYILSRSGTARHGPPAVAALAGRAASAVKQAATKTRLVPVLKLMTNASTRWIWPWRNFRNAALFRGNYVAYLNSNCFPS